MLTLRELNIANLFYDNLYITWEFETTTEDLTKYRLTLYRAEAASSNLNEYAQRATNIPVNQGLFVDEIENLSHHNRIWYYRVKVVNTETQEEEIFPALDQPAYYYNYQSPDNRYRFIRKRKEQSLKWIGRPMSLLKKRSWGQRCEIGWDPILQGPSGKRCDECTCFGTGWLQAYYNPIAFKAVITPNPKINQIQLFGEFMPSDALLSSLNYPPLQPKDVIVDDNNKRWVVEQTRQIEKLGVPLEQISRLSLIHPTDELYQYNIEIPPPAPEPPPPVDTVFIPQLIGPTASLQAEATIVEVGAESVEVRFNWNAGQILGGMENEIWDAQKVQNPRAGEVTQLTINNQQYAPHLVNQYQTVQLTEPITTNITLAGQISYAPGPQPVDSKGENFNLELPGNTLTRQVTIQAGRRMFYGGLTTPAVTSEHVRSLASSYLNPTAGLQFDFRVPAGKQYIVIAYPASLPPITQILSVDAMTIDFTSYFTQSTVSVAGANNTPDVLYRVYTQELRLDSGYDDSVLYKVTL